MPADERDARLVPTDLGPRRRAIGSSINWPLLWISMPRPRTVWRRSRTSPPGSIRSARVGSGRMWRSPWARRRRWNSSRRRSKPSGEFRYATSRSPLPIPPRLPPPGRRRVRLAGLRGHGRGGGGAVRRRDDPFLPKKPHFEREGEERHLPVHGGRAEPHRSLRPEARTDAAARQAAARQLRQGHHADGHRRQQRCSPASGSSRSTARAASTSRDWLPHMAKCADDFAVLRSCQADGLNHVGSVCQMNTGSILAGRPSASARGRSTASAP